MQIWWHIPMPNVQWKTPDDGQRNCPKHVEFLDKNKLGKSSASVGFIKKSFECRLLQDNGLNSLLPVSSSSISVEGVNLISLVYTVMVTNKCILTSVLITQWTATCFGQRRGHFNHLTPNGHYMGRTAQLTSRRYILYIYSTNIRTEYFKHA